MQSNQNSQKVLILNYGSQYAELLLKVCRECAVRHEMHYFNVDLACIKAVAPQAIILSGGPGSVYEKECSQLSSAIWDYSLQNKIPIFGICYGMQDMHQAHGGVVSRSQQCEFGPIKLILNEEGMTDPLFKDIPRESDVWMSHFDSVTTEAPNFTTLASTENSVYAASCDRKKGWWSVQFHPEVFGSEFGVKMFDNFFRHICNIPRDDTLFHSQFEELFVTLKKKIGTKHIFGAISGGMDSMVAAALVQKVTDKPIHAIFIDTGLMRKDEVTIVKQIVNRQIPRLKLNVIDASEIFFYALKGVTDPQKKRLIIGKLFIDIFCKSIEEAQADLGCKSFDDALLLQGTICSDVIESSSKCPVKGHQRQIKAHHNVGGLPENMKIGLLEPLKQFFKDEVQEYGRRLGIEPILYQRYPFPGPGLAIRIVGEVTRERVAILQKADAIFTEELEKSNEAQNVSQAFAILLPECRAVGVAGDERTYGMGLVLRAVESKYYLTARSSKLSYELLQKISNHIMNEIQDISRVMYDITSKPPGTVEWE